MSGFQWQALYHMPKFQNVARDGLDTLLKSISAFFMLLLWLMDETKPFVVHLLSQTILEVIWPLQYFLFLIILYSGKKAMKSCAEIFILVELVEI